MSNKQIVGGGKLEGKVVEIPKRVLQVVQEGDYILFLASEPYNYYNNESDIILGTAKLIERECNVILGFNMLDSRVFHFSASKSSHTEEDHCIFIILSETIEGDKQFLHMIHYSKTFDKYTDPRDLYGWSKEGEYKCTGEIKEYPISGRIYVIDENHICYFDSEQNLHIIKMNFEKREIENRTPGYLFDVFSNQNISLKDFENNGEFEILSVKIDYVDELNLSMIFNYKGIGNIKVTAKILSGLKIKFDSFECENLNSSPIADFLNNESKNNEIDFQQIFKVLHQYIDNYLAYNSSTPSRKHPR